MIFVDDPILENTHMETGICHLAGAIPQNAVLYPPLGKSVLCRTASFSELVAHALACSDEVGLCGATADEALSELKHLIGEQGPAYHAFLALHGLEVDAGRSQVAYFPEGWPAIRAEIDALNNEFGEGGPASTRWVIGCSSDAHAYHTTYIEDFLFMLQHYDSARQG
jgi:hypothetical protein